MSCSPSPLLPSLAPNERPSLFPLAPTTTGPEGPPELIRVNGGMGETGFKPELESILDIFLPLVLCLPS